MKNKMEDLRDHLFAELERLGETKEPTKGDLARAKAISDVAGKLIESARVEVDYLKVHTSVANSKHVRSKFIESTPALSALPDQSRAPRS